MPIIDHLIHRARVRLLVSEGIAQLAFAGAITAGGLAVILIVGTRYLEPWTIVLLAICSIALGGFRAARHIPGTYRIARRIDCAARTHDLISTAVHFAGHSLSETGLLGAQRAQAEAAAREIDLAAVLPLKFPRALYPLAAFGLLASSLVVLRYALTRSLDLRAPITQVLFEDQLARRDVKKTQPNANPQSFKALKAAESLMARLNMPPSGQDQPQNPDELDKAIDQALAPPSANQAKAENAANGQKSGQQNSATGLEQGQNSDPLNGNQGAAQNQNAASPQSQQNGAPNSKENRANNSEGNNSSLLSKLKDAVSNMLSRARQENSPEGQKSASQQNAQSGRPDQKSGDKNSGGKGQQETQAQTDAQEGEPSGDPQQGQQAQGKNAAKMSAQNSAQAGSGIGNQNGEKDVRAAEQLKAMGKISEIIGKRAATITGETMVEVQSGNQQLKTAYSERTAEHGEAESDINRDQIPPALQTYVANYFEQVRKSPEKATGSRSGAAKAPEPDSKTVPLR